MQTDKAVNLSNLRREFKVVTKLAYVLTFFVTQSNKLYASPIVHYEINQLIINYSCFILIFMQKCYEYIFCALNRNCIDKRGTNFV